MLSLRFTVAELPCFLLATVEKELYWFTFRYRHHRQEMVFSMCYSKTYRDSSSHWNGFPWTLLLVLLILFTRPSFLVDGNTQLEAKDVVNDFYNRYNVTEQNDLVFILDRSSSISRTAWISIINFVKVSGQNNFLGDNLVLLVHC